MRLECVRITVINTSPRPDGNSVALADAFVLGSREAGHEVSVVELDGVVQGFLRDCRRCRRTDGTCSIPDDVGGLVHGALTDADAIVFSMPLYFYGMPGVLKALIDRLVCYLGAGYPRAAEVREALAGQRVGLLVTSEEDYPALLGPLVGQLTELARYLRQDFVGVVHGVGNRRGEVVRDPADPVAAARRFGREFEHRRYSDYHVGSQRSGSVWDGELTSPGA